LRAQQADAVRDELQVRQAQVRRQQLQDLVRLEVADAEESLQQARAAYEAAVEARRLQEQSVNVEQQTFAVGLSTNLIVIQYQNYLAQARSTEVASKGAYIKAMKLIGAMSSVGPVRFRSQPDSGAIRQSPAVTRAVIAKVQSDGACWCGGSEWRGQPAMRISVCSWATTEEDVQMSLAAIRRIAEECRR